MSTLFISIICGIFWQKTSIHEPCRVLMFQSFAQRERKETNGRIIVHSPVIYSHHFPCLDLSLFENQRKRTRISWNPWFGRKPKSHLPIPHWVQKSQPRHHRDFWGLVLTVVGNSPPWVPDISAYLVSRGTNYLFKDVCRAVLEARDSGSLRSRGQICLPSHRIKTMSPPRAKVKWICMQPL